MGEYFRPFRRKLGLLTLVMACFLTACWMRSQAIIDTIVVTPFSRQFVVISSPGQIALKMELDEQHHDWPNGWQRGRIKKYNPNQWHQPTFFMFSNSDRDGFVTSNELIVLYRSIVLPLTAISAWLLLSKPRQKPKTTT